MFVNLHLFDSFILIMNNIKIEVYCSNATNQDKKKIKFQYKKVEINTDLKKSPLIFFLLYQTFTFIKCC